MRTDAYDTGFVDLAGDQGACSDKSRAAPATASWTGCTPEHRSFGARGIP
jgi:hypothetical protein